MNVVENIDVDKVIDTTLEKWAKTERSYYLTTIILIAVVAVCLGFYSIYSIRQTTKDFTAELSKQRTEFLDTMQEQNSLFTEAIYDIKAWKYNTK